MKFNKSELPEFVWYRLLKVLYIFVLGLSALLGIVFTLGDPVSGILFLIFSNLIIEAFRRAFFYIVTATVAEKSELERAKKIGIMASKKMSRGLALFVGFMVFGLAAAALPPTLKVLVGFSIILFNLQPSSVAIADIEAVIQIGSLLLAGVLAQKIYKFLYRADNAKPAKAQKTA